MASVYTACPVNVTIYSTGSKFQPVLNSTELHAFTLAARSYALFINLIPRPFINSLGMRLDVYVCI